MKPGIHPEYKIAKVHCACGNEFHTRSTQDDIHLDVCSVCHPYFTGKQRLMDTAGRVERFRRKWGGAGDSMKRDAPDTTAAEPAEAEAAEAPAAKAGKGAKAEKAGKAKKDAAPAEAEAAEDAAADATAEDAPVGEEAEKIES